MAFSVRDLVERGLWSAAQGGAGVFAAVNFVGLPTLATWSAVGTAAAVAALISVAKTLGVSASQVAQGVRDVTAAVDTVSPALPGPVRSVVRDVETVVGDVVGRVETGLASAPPVAAPAPVAPGDALAAMQQA